MRRQLMQFSAATTGLVLMAFLIPIGVLIRSQAEQKNILAATLDAHSRVALVSVSPQEAATAVHGSVAAISVFTSDGRVFGAMAPRTASVELAFLGRAFTARSAGGVEVLVPVSGPAGTAVIRAFVSSERLHEGVTRAWVSMALVGLGLFAIGLALANRLGRRLIGAASDLGQVADRLAHGDFEARVRPSGPPELRQAGAEINRLAARIGELLEMQRRQAADIAHRLRTPLTALRLDTGSLKDPQERDRLTGDADELGRMVDEVIRAASRPIRQENQIGCDLVAVTAERVEFWAALAEDTGRRIERFFPQETLVVNVAPADMAAAIDVLLENAFTYSPESADIHVTVSRIRNANGRLIVEDAGPGFLPGQTGDGRRRTGSTGLGLDIASRTATASGGELTIGSSPLGGTRIQVDFGPVTSQLLS